MEKIISSLSLRMTPEQNKSLQEILDNVDNGINPLTLKDLHVLQVRYGVDLDFYKDKSQAIITLENSKEYFFYLENGYYHLRSE